MSSTLTRIVSLLMVGAWTGLLLARGRFWDPPVDRLSLPEASADTQAPTVHVVVPARNEAPILGTTLPTVLAQRYAGTIGVTVADDGSSDGTAARALEIAATADATERFAVVGVAPRPAGWAGKVWALGAGIAAARAAGARPAYWLFTDADITLDSSAVASLVATARADRRDVVSLMVQLHCTGIWERLLIPAFVFFFAKLYPFAWVAADRHRTAAAAGGCILISDSMLERIGGIECIRGALIDDCSLAAAVKAHGGRLRLELSTRNCSVRPYDNLEQLWDMVARSAYTQLRESPALVAGAVAGMLLLYALPPIAVLLGVLRRDASLGIAGATAWTLMSVAYLPILRRYGQPRAAATLLPLAAMLYTLMTLDSARRHARGRGGAWKGRIHDAGAAAELRP